MELVLTKKNLRISIIHICVYFKYYEKNTYNHYSFGVDAMEKARVDFLLDKSVKKQIKDLAYKKDTTATALYTKWIMEGLARETEQTRLNVE